MQVIAGKDKGKVTEVVRVITHSSQVLCRDINIKTKHVKGKAEGEAGQIIQVFGRRCLAFVNARACNRSLIP